MKKRIFIALIILITFLSVGVISANEIGVNDTYAVEDVSSDLLSVDVNGVGSDSSNNLSINNVDANLDENTLGASDNSSKTEVYIDAPDVELYYKNGTKYIATLIDVDGNKLANQDLIFTISGVNYTRTTDENGSASIAINLLPGTYNFNVYYAGDDTYSNASSISVGTVYSTISGENIVKYYRNDTQYYATFLDGDGSPLANTNVTFNINGVFYTRTTNSSGVARLNINLLDGIYILTAIHPDTGLMYSNNVTVLPTISGDDLYKVYRDSHQYYATFLDSDGSPLVNTNVTFNINGVFYTRTTNSSGVARLNINLMGGTYILTAIHPNDKYQYSNIVNVLSSSATALYVDNFTYYADDTQIINVTLYDELGYTVPDQDIIITVNEVKYTATTDDDGVATITTDLDTGIYGIYPTYTGVSPYKSSSGEGFITILEGLPVEFVVNNTVIYYNNSESFDVTVMSEGDYLVNEPVYFTINGATYKRTTDENGTAKLNINLIPGVYDITYKFNTTGYAQYYETTQIAVIDGNTSTLTGSNTTVSYGLSQQFTVTLAVGDVALPSRTIIFEINGVNYTRYTDDDGIAGITINLQPGTYLVKYYYSGQDRIASSSGQAYVTVKPRTETSLSWASSTQFSNGSNINLMVYLVDSSNNAIPDEDIIYTISSKNYTATTNSTGFATLTRTLSAGTYLISYSFEGDSDYLPSEGSTYITVSKASGSSGYGYWAFGKDMYSIDLSKLASLGTTDIFLNFYAFTLYSESSVLSWIASANSYGINVHIWMQAFYEGSWVNPISGGSINTAYFNEKISEATYYAGLTGVAGVHLDYLRYPGTAYKTSGGADAITEFAKQVTEACKAVNPNIIMSAAVMPETTSNIYYYGQDIPALTKYLDVIVPMQYKGNYNAGTSWLASTTKWFVQNSNGAQVWSGLEAYISDDNPTKLSYTELFADAQTVTDNGADGVILFRFGLSNFLDFTDLVDPAYGDEIALSDVLDAANYLKSYIEDNYVLPSSIDVGTGTYTVPQVLAMMNQALSVIQGDLDEIVALLVTEPESSSGDVIYSELGVDEYLDVSDATLTYCISNAQAPAYMASSIGNIKYETLVYMYSRILTYYSLNSQLPYVALVNNFLDNPTLTVNMLPSYSTSKCQYINYTTTWLNYCPICGYYGTLLINPKGTVEGELTCYHCDADFCGVTGNEKISGSTYVLTRLSESVPTDSNISSDSVSISSILSAAASMADYYAENEYFPDSITMTEGTYTLQQFLYLMGRAIVQLNVSNFNSISMVEIEGGPSTPNGDVIDGYLTKDQYLDVANRVANYISSNSWIPNYSSSTLGKIAYAELLDSFSRVLDYYNSNGVLPSSLHIVYTGASSKTISALAKSLTQGLSSDRDKAVALFNYVRDEISYSFYYNTQKGAEGTLEAGTGNCCDQAQLLVAMARAVNLTARFATGYCYFYLSGATYGHVWVQFLIDGVWVNADPVSVRNSFGVIVNWNTATYTDRGTYDVLPY